jgi:hypothetical protein
MGVTRLRSSADKLDVNPTWCRMPSSSYKPSKSEPMTFPFVE